ISGELIEIDENNKLHFKDNQTFTNTGGFTMEISIFIMGETEVQHYELDNFFGNGTYTTDGATVEIYNEETDTSIEYIIKELTESTLKMKGSTGDVNIEGAETVPFDIPIY